MASVVSGGRHRGDWERITVVPPHAHVFETHTNAAYTLVKSVILFGTRRAFLCAAGMPAAKRVPRYYIGALSNSFSFFVLG